MTVTDEEWFAAVDSNQLSLSQAEVQQARDRGLQRIIVVLTVICLFLGCLTLWVNKERKELIQEVGELKLQLRAMQNSRDIRPREDDRFVLVSPKLIRM